MIQNILWTADCVADALGVLVRELNANELLNFAQESHHHSVNLETEIVAEPLRVLLRAYDQEARLSLVGRTAARWDIIRCLSNLARLRAAEQTCPEIIEEPIQAPVFVTGLPRSGTSFLQRLLAEDMRHRTPRCWETIYPYPDNGNPRPDPRAKRVARQLRTFARLAPEFPSLHPFGATSPQECTEITAHVFRSLRFDTTHHVPSYRRWLDQEGHLKAYRFHKRFLQHLQHQDRPAPARRWVLKAPEHVFALDALLAVYPDARIIFVHRDPLKVLPSVARLTEVLRAPFTRRLDRLAIGRQVIDDWAQGAANMIEASQHPAIAERITHVHYRTLVTRPLDTVEAIYRALELDFAPVAARVARIVEREPRGGYGQNRYSLEPYGLDPVRERERFQDYVSRFSVEAEFDASARSIVPGDAAQTVDDTQP